MHLEIENNIGEECVGDHIPIRQLIEPDTGETSIQPNKPTEMEQARNQRGEEPCLLWTFAINHGPEFNRWPLADQIEFINFMTILFKETQQKYKDQNLV